MSETVERHRSAGSSMDRPTQAETGNDQVEEYGLVQSLDEPESGDLADMKPALHALLEQVSGLSGGAVSVPLGLRVQEPLENPLGNERSRGIDVN
jgi:hypothetical protein